LEGHQANNIPQSGYSACFRNGTGSYLPSKINSKERQIMEEEAKTNPKITVYEIGLVFPALLKALEPVGGRIIRDNFTLHLDGWRTRPRVSVQLFFDPTKLHEYIAQYVLPEMNTCQCKERA
jgi:hypothetical protein